MLEDESASFRLAATPGLTLANGLNTVKHSIASAAWARTSLQTSGIPKLNPHAQWSTRLRRHSRSRWKQIDTREEHSLPQGKTSARVVGRHRKTSYGH